MFCVLGSPFFFLPFYLWVSEPAIKKSWLFGLKPIINRDRDTVDHVKFTVYISQVQTIYSIYQDIFNGF